MINSNVDYALCIVTYNCTVMLYKLYYKANAKLEFPREKEKKENQRTLLWELEENVEGINSNWK